MPWLGAPPADVALSTDDLEDGIVTTAKIAANNVDGTLTKDALIADYSDVTITAADLVMYGDATDSNNTKRDTVQGILDLAGGGGWEFVSVVTASASATVAFTNMVSGYDYQYVFIDVLPATDGQTFHSQLGVSGPTYRTSSYQSVTAWISLAGTSATSGAVTGNAQIIGPSVGSATDEGIHRAAITLSDPANASFDTTWAIAPSGTCDDTSGDAMSISGGGGKYTTAEAHVAIKFYFASGNVASGRTYQYRRANA
jgi:hypothetical protein